MKHGTKSTDESVKLYHGPVQAAPLHSCKYRWLQAPATQHAHSTATPDGPDNRHAGIEPSLRDHEPFRGVRLHRLVYLTDDDGRALGCRARRPRPPPIQVNQIRQVLMMSWVARNGATPGATQY